MAVELFLVPHNGDIHGSGLGQFRYVVERTLPCLSHFRRLPLCYESFAVHFQAFHDLDACCLIVTRMKQCSLQF
jgi:hypothetical protein